MRSRSRSVGSVPVRGGFFVVGTDDRRLRQPNTNPTQVIFGGFSLISMT
jgi:hypothetical protein